MSNALDGKQYEFELYDATEGASCGTLAADITTFILPPEGSVHRAMGRGILEGIGKGL